MTNIVLFFHRCGGLYFQLFSALFALLPKKGLKIVDTAAKLKLAVVVVVSFEVTVTHLFSGPNLSRQYSRPRYPLIPHSLPDEWRREDGVAVTTKREIGDGCVELTQSKKARCLHINYLFSQKYSKRKLHNNPFNHPLSLSLLQSDFPIVIIATNEVCQGLYAYLAELLPEVSNIPLPLAPFPFPPSLPLPAPKRRPFTMHISWI